MARIEFTSDTHFYASTTGSDSNDGLSPGAPLPTRGAWWDRLLRVYDLKRYKAILNMADGEYTDVFEPRGNPVGGDAFGQVTIRGNLTNPRNVVIKPSAGNYAFLLQDGCNLFVEGMKIDMSDANCDGITLTQRSNLAFQKLVFGPNHPTRHDIQPSWGTFLHVYGDYEIDKGASGGIQTGAALNAGNPTIGVANPTGITNGMSVSGQYIQAGTTVQSISGAYVTLTLPPTGTIGFTNLTFGGSAAGTVGMAHIQQDSYSVVYYKPGITLTINGTPHYQGAFSINDNSLIGFENCNIVGSFTGAPFIVQNGGCTHPGVQNSDGSQKIDFLPGTVLQLSASWGGGQNVITLSAGDWNTLNNYLSQYSNYTGLCVQGANQPIGQRVIGMASGNQVQLLLPTTGGGSGTLKFGGFAFGNGKYFNLRPFILPAAFA